ncbi:hypothetical protein PY310_12115 [Pseudarthrobacter sp. H3Y2-7]|uniref:DUF6707 family protein n=1 Tax=Pseudarthrobacter naphthalenicus TaxID=3031328 RepID=UPI0023AF850F|nr:DUF6707 family protein [Pseudarthrobacter sp. H3Y2-7]MDE8669323.1 hypothetical protein [Pseudarthrobacter sp. H3Y2-7]
MTETPAARHYGETQAGSLTSGDHLLLPDGGRTAEIERVELEFDDFGVAAVILASLTGGGTIRIAAGSTVNVLDTAVSQGGLEAGPDDVTRLPAAASGHEAAARGPHEAATAGEAPGVEANGGEGTDREGTGAGTTGAETMAVPARGAEQPGNQPAATGGAAPTAPAVVVPPQPAIPPAVSGPSADELALIPAPAGTPEAVVEAAAEAHPDAVGVLLLADKLAKGINFKSGSCLKDLSDLAHELFITLKDPDGALAVADLLNVLPFDGNPGRWASVEASLALSSYICRQDRQEERAEVYEKLLRTPENQETDPFKARMNAKVRQRSLNEPNLYDKEIFRSIDNSNHEAEREWRLLRLESLLFLRAHGGSETIGLGELQRRISNELEAVRA